MTVRRNTKPRGSLDHGTMTGLQAYMADLSEHLRQEMGPKTRQPSKQ